MAAAWRKLRQQIIESIEKGSSVAMAKGGQRRQAAAAVSKKKSDINEIDKRQHHRGVGSCRRQAAIYRRCKRHGVKHQ